MNTESKMIEAYNEAKTYCSLYVNYKGDKRGSYYKSLQRSVVELYIGRMNNFGKRLSLPIYVDVFFKNITEKKDINV